MRPSQVLTAVALAALYFLVAYLWLGADRFRKDWAIYYSRHTRLLDIWSFGSTKFFAAHPRTHFLWIRLIALVILALAIFLTLVIIGLFGPVEWA